MTPTLTVTDAMREAGSKAAWEAYHRYMSKDDSAVHIYLAMHNARTPASQTSDDVERMTEVVHRARFPEDRTPTPFAEEDHRGREYCRRIAIAALAAQPKASPTSDDAERVARAIFRCGYEGDWDEAVIERHWDEASDEERHYPEARAAIAALAAQPKGEG